MVSYIFTLHTHKMLTDADSYTTYRQRPTFAESNSAASKRIASEHPSLLCCYVGVSSRKRLQQFQKRELLSAPPPKASWA